ncbi:hypothetical protein LZ554_007594 [Drepanopeziza brunnea f. sp. 'monogermtubi']|nr:hypothetical protein LZ554_007594 [Drepanopeziza brunnea f. sp. 'monogermtubi']
MSSIEKNRYWIPNLDISKKVITQELQYFLGPDATVRPYTYEGEDGFLITTPGECLTDAQIDDICCKSKEVWERQAAARSRNGLDADLKRPLHQPILISKGQPRSSTFARSRRHSGERERGSRRGSGERRHDGYDGYDRRDMW